MSLIATDTARFSNLVKQELFPENAYCREVVSATEGSAKTYAVGTVLGVTSGGVWKISVQTAADGSQTPAAIVVEDKAIPASTATKVLVLRRGPAIVSKSALVLDSTFDNDTKKNAAYAAIEALGILVNTAV